MLSQLTICLLVCFVTSTNAFAASAESGGLSVAAEAAAAEQRKLFTDPSHCFKLCQAKHCKKIPGRAIACMDKCQGAGAFPTISENCQGFVNHPDEVGDPSPKEIREEDERKAAKAKRAAEEAKARAARPPAALPKLKTSVKFVAPRGSSSANAWPSTGHALVQEYNSKDFEGKEQAQNAIRLLATGEAVDSTRPGGRESYGITNERPWRPLEECHYLTLIKNVVAILNEGKVDFAKFRKEKPTATKNINKVERLYNDAKVNFRTFSVRLDRLCRGGAEKEDSEEESAGEEEEEEKDFSD